MFGSLPAMPIPTNARTQRYAAASYACQPSLVGVASRSWGWHLADECVEVLGAVSQHPVGVPV